MTERDEQILQRNVEYYQFSSRKRSSTYHDVAARVLSLKSKIPETFGEIERKKFFGDLVESLLHMNWELDLLFQFNVHLQSTLARKVINSIQQTIDSCKEIITEELYSGTYEKLLAQLVMDEEKNEIKSKEIQKELGIKIIEDINSRLNFESGSSEREKVIKDTNKIALFIEKF